uniref:Uncharacterized protein n=1 Tax=Streptomyces sp. NBC_01393 TaxID=2903851 RepID=A0AAU3HNP5_9ACTN
MTPLSTIASSEWHAGYHGWVPYEDQILGAFDHAAVANPPKVQVSSRSHLQLYVCLESPGHPHTGLFQ